MKKKNSYAVITGASSGIGEEFVKRLAREGYKIILVARRKERLEKTKEKLTSAEVECEIITADLGQISECRRLMDALSDRNIGVFINNAGLGDLNLFNEMDINKAIRIIDVNIKALTILFHGLLNQFINNNNGIIINVSSIAGLLPAGPYMSVYYATKSYVTSLTRAVDYEIKNKYNIKVKALCPGPVDTEFNEVANSKFKLKSISPDKCVNYTIKKLKSKRIILTPTIGVRITELFSRFIPIKLLLYFCSKNQKKKK